MEANVLVLLKLYQGYLNENGNLIQRKAIMHAYIISHDGDVNENDNFYRWKLIIHGYNAREKKYMVTKNAWGDLNENENYKNK